MMFRRTARDPRWLRLGLFLLSLTLLRSTSAQVPVPDHWVAVTVPPSPGQFFNPAVSCIDGAGNLYVYDADRAGIKLQMRDPQGHWTALAQAGKEHGQIGEVTDLAADAAGNLYVSEWSPSVPPRIQRRSPDGTWTLIASWDSGSGPVERPESLAVDAAGNLYVADSYRRAVLKRDPQGNWTSVATYGLNTPGKVEYPIAVAVDGKGQLFVVEWNRVQKRDAGGNWTLLYSTFRVNPGVSGYLDAAVGPGDTLYLMGTLNDYPPDMTIGIFIERFDTRAPVPESQSQSFPPYGKWQSGSARTPATLTADTAGNVYVPRGGKISGWTPDGAPASLAESSAPVPGQIAFADDMALDPSGNLYVTDGYRRVQMRDPQGNWSVVLLPEAGPGVEIYPGYVCTDDAGSLYLQSERVENRKSTRIRQKRDGQGNWFLLPADAPLPCLFAWQWMDNGVRPEARDSAGNRYALGQDPASSQSALRLIRTDPQGSVTTVAPPGPGTGQVSRWSPVIVDPSDRLYLFDARIQRRETDGSWRLIAPHGTGPGQVLIPGSLGFDRWGNLYAEDTPGEGRRRLQKWSPEGQSWELLRDGFNFYINDLEADASGDTYLLDRDHHRILYRAASTLAPQRGDVDENGTVDIQDAILSLKIAVKLHTPTTTQTTLGDLDLNEKLNVADSMLILRMIVGL